MSKKERATARWIEENMKKHLNLDECRRTLKECYPGRLVVIREIHTIRREITHE